MGLLDLPAPLLGLIDHGLASVGLPPLIRVIFYALVSALICMTIYRWSSRQEQLGELSGKTRTLRRELATYDGPFDGLMQRVRQLLKLSTQHLGLSLFPALLGSLPILFLLPWMSNQFGLEFPAPGTPVSVTVEMPDVPHSALTWTGIEVQQHSESGWVVTWPDQSGSLMHDQSVLLELPTRVPASIVHQYQPIFNRLIGNPVGYLPDDAPMEVIRIDLPRQELHPLGPGWLRSWLTVYLLIVIAGSLFLKWRWRLH